MERSRERKEEVCSAVNVNRCFRSAPAQKVGSEVDDRIRARVGEDGYGESCRRETSCERAVRSSMLIALRDEGRFREIILMLPL